jgi:PAS domain S-box-containing protein
VRVLQAKAGEYDGMSPSFQRWIRAGELIPAESNYERTRPNGTVLEVRSVPLPGGGVVRTYSDITARRAAEHALRESEALYRLLAENSTDMIVRTDLAGIRRYLSPASREILGYAPEELVGTMLIDFVHPDDRETVAQDLAQILTGAIERQTAVYRVRHKNGAWTWSETRRRLVRGDDGKPLEVVAVVRDVSDRKAAEEALQRSEERYRLLADNSSDIIVLKPSFGGQRYISPAVRTVLGYEPEAFLSRPTADIIHPDDRARVEAIYNSVGPNSPEATSVHRLRHRDGHYIWVEVVFKWMVGPAGEPAIIATNRDVTERERQAEELRSAKDAAEQASEAKTQFLATISHEIRTPLNGITGFTDLILDRTDLDPVLRRQVELIRTSSSALLTVINDVLDFSKVEAGAVELHPEPFWPKAMMDNCASIVRELAAKKGLALHVQVGDVLPNRVLGDEPRLRQILLNLLNNAIKFTPAGMVELRLRHESISSTEDRLHFAIRDTGIGIPRTQQARLFERFSQVDSAANRQYAGTGLGLAISKQLVQLMGGSIGVDTEPGVGSTFWFSITVPRVAEAAVTACPPKAAPPLSRRSACILVAEDVEINQEIARAILERAGYAVDVVSDGAEAIKALNQTPYDLVLMDVQMPVVDGLQATRHIRASEAPGRRLPIIALTANVYSEQVAGCKAAGMDDHIGKPFQPIELLQTVDRWLQSTAEDSIAGSSTDSEQLERSAAESLLGDDAVAVLLEQLRHQLTALHEVDRDSASVDRAALARQAHKLVSAAGMLGFRDLSSLCSDLETACLNNTEFGDVLDRARAVCGALLERLAADQSGCSGAIGRRAGQGTARSR